MSSLVTPNSIELVAEKLSALRRRYSWARIAIELLWLLALSLLLWLLLAVVDFTLELTTTQRRFALMACLLGLASAGFIRLRQAFREAEPHRFAGLLETQFDEFGQRLRTILEAALGRIIAPSEMMNALGNQALGRWDTANPAQVLPIRKLSIGVGACIVAAIALMPFYANEHWRIALKRALGQEVPYATFDVQPGNVNLIEGEDVELKLGILGRRAQNVMLRYRQLPLANSESKDSRDGTLPVEEQPKSSSWTEVELVRLSPSGKAGADLSNGSDSTGSKKNSAATQSVVRNDGLVTFSMAEPAQFGTWLRKLSRPVEYQFVTSAGSSNMYRVEVQPLVNVDDFEIQVVAPEYTGIGPRIFERPDLKVLAGSTVLATITTSHPLEHAELTLGPTPDALQTVDNITRTEDPCVWQFELPSTSSLVWQFAGYSADRVPLSPLKGRLHVRSDGPPKFKWREPGLETRVTTLTEVTLSVDVDDDYGIQECGVVFQLGDEEEFVLAEWAASPESNEDWRRGMRLDEVLPLETFGLGQFDFVSYYAYAIDNREGEPHRSESDLRYIDIRPLRQYFQANDLFGDGSSSGGGARGFATSTNEIIRRQRSLINQTRKLLRSSQSSLDIASQLGSFDSAVEAQSELAGFVQFLMEGLRVRGFDDNLDSFASAEASMLLAADSLAVGELELAQSQQQDAMRSLVEAQDELENLLSSLSSDQQQSLRDLRQQMEQALGLAREQTDQKLAAQLRAIAAGQLGLGKTATELNKDFERATKLADPDSDTASMEDLSRPADNSDLLEQTSDRIEELSREQRDLQENLLDVSEALSERVASSELVGKRFQEVMDGMDRQVVDIASQRLDAVSKASGPISEALVELALLIEAVAPADSVDRLAAFRDLTASVAQMESDLADALERKATAADEAKASDAQEDLTERMAELETRLETLREALESMQQMSDGGETADRLRQFVENNDFLSVLESSQQASAADPSEMTLNSEQLQEFAGNARNRAETFRDSAVELENLYRELVAPQLEKLREMEQLAEAIRQAARAGDGDSDDVAAMQQLAEDLRAMGLSDLAEMLASSPGLSEERLQGVLDALRARIQTLVLLELGTADDSAIPSRYQELVDLYFRALSGDVPQNQGAE